MEHGTPEREPTSLIGLVLIALFFCARAAFAADAPDGDYFPFVIPWDDSAPTPLSMTERLADAPAGKHGPIRADGDRLVFQDGTPVKLWGIGMSASAAFPPSDKTVANALVKKLTKYGFNVVRIRAIDEKVVGLYENWLKTGKLDEKTMDRVDYFIAELRKAGIYYSLGFSVASSRHAARGSVAATQYARQPKRYNGIQLFDKTAVDDTARWYSAVMSHVNPYSKVSYGEDPAFVFIPAVAEDSIFHSYFSKGDLLGQENEIALRKRFNEYLASRYPDRESLEAAWQEKGKRGLQDGEDPKAGTVEMVPWSQVSEVSRARRIDLMQFFYEIDRSFAQEMQDRARSAGYRGLFTATNNWFGLGSELVSHDVGNYLESHAFFDHPGREGPDAKTLPETVSNESYISVQSEKRLHPLYDRNFYRLFMTAATDRPLIVSEWNHSAWSDYTYEGPLLLTAYSSFQGYRGLLIHTYFGQTKDVRVESGNRALAWVGNPVLAALTPTLALAFRRGDISEGGDTVTVPVGKDTAELMDLAATNGEKTQLGDGRIALDTGFVHKLRLRLPGAEQSGARAPGPGSDAPATGELKSSTGEIVWNRDPRRGWLRVDTPRFQAAAGHMENGLGLRDANVQLAEHGAVTMIALDDRDIASSRNILVTAVSSFRNTNESIEPQKGRNGRVIGEVVRDPGTGPTLLKRVRGSVSLQSKLSERPHVYSMATDGSLTELPIQPGERNGDAHAFRFDLGARDSPWYVIKF